MKDNIKRRQEMFKSAAPTPGTLEYLYLTNKVKRLEQNPKFKENAQKTWEKANRSLHAQYLSNCELITELALRHYLLEFNHRTWKAGLRSMPLMFNIMEAFFRYRNEEIYFELIEEENYYISFFEFIDFITSNGFSENKKLIEENITQDIIYSFDVGKDREEITFKSDTGEEFIIAGISLIRRVNEVTVLMIAGKKQLGEDTPIPNDFKISTDNPNKKDLMRDMQKILDENSLSYEFIDPDKKYIKTSVVARIDLETMTIDARYVAEEMNMMFNIITDSTDGFVNSQGEFISEKSKNSYYNSAKKIEEYSAIFEAIKYSLYLPYYFNHFEDVIAEETHDTKFKKEFSSPITKRKFSNTLGYKCSIKQIYSLDHNKIFTPDIIKLRDDLFNVQSDGYWKYLAPDEIGLDKKGKPIHGRTWVNQTLSWFQAKEESLVITKPKEKYSGKNAGYIYILRNPQMDADIFKIGLTRNNVDERAKQLSKTSIPDKFYKAQEWAVKDCILAEKNIHEKLEHYRVDPRREFFKIEYQKAVKNIAEIIDEINGMDI